MNEKLKAKARTLNWMFVRFLPFGVSHFLRDLFHFPYSISSAYSSWYDILYPSIARRTSFFRCIVTLSFSQDSTIKPGFSVVFPTVLPLFPTPSYSASRTCNSTAGSTYPATPATGMAPPFYLSYIRSPPTVRANPFPSPPAPIVPSPLRIFKRLSRKDSFNSPALATLASPLPESSFASSDSHSKSPTASPPSIYFSSTDLPLLALPSSSSVSITRRSLCDLCLNPLSTLQTYSFPQTAPAVTDRVRRLFPIVSESPTFCGPCFEAMHAVHICWGCGLPIYRAEERVGCGWAWWHWGCVRCLLCRVRHPAAEPAISRAQLTRKQTPLPPPPWTEAPITLSTPPSCTACMRELQHLAYRERARKERRRHDRTSSRQLLHSDSVGSCDGARSRNVSLVARGSSSMPIRKASFGVKYPPLPRWMQRRLSVAEGDEGSLIPERWGERRPLVPKWMEKLPGNMKGLRRRSGRVGSGGGVERRVGSNGRVEKRS